VEVPFGRLAEQARQLAERFDKPDLDVRIEPHGVRVGSRYRPFFSALGHAVRNALDHGVEPPEEREAGGKPRAGRMSLRAETTDDGLRISVEDDGRGIDDAAVAGIGLESMRNRAEELGGRLRIGHRAGGGTVLAALLPLHDGQREWAPA
jgi:two-component system chemotaxis sensor kinase CheA